MTKKYSFSGHESFPCKSLWLKKGYDFVVQEKNFNDPNAVIDLGVGKNMVASIRFWLKAFGICENDNASWLGHYLFDNQTGRDKYIEDLATLWLLHFHLIFCGEASIYNLFFCDFQREHSSFQREQITNYIKIRLIENGTPSIFNKNTIKKDIGVLLQNYVLPRMSQSNEDYSSLLIDLDLIRQNSEGGGYFFNVEGKRKVTKEVFLYGLLKVMGEDKSISYDAIREQIGYIFCMTDIELIQMLKQLASDYSENLAYSDIAGIRQVQIIKELDPVQVLNDYYEKV